MAAEVDPTIMTLSYKEQSQFQAFFKTYELKLKPEEEELLKGIAGDIIGKLSETEIVPVSESKVPEATQSAAAGSLNIKTENNLLNTIVPNLPPLSAKITIKSPLLNSGVPTISMPYGLNALRLRYEKNPVKKSITGSFHSVSTSDWLTAKKEDDVVELEKEIENLKQNDNWSLRQPKKFKAPMRKKTHWDYLLDEMKWMALDFRQERRWKMASSVALSEEAAEHATSKIKSASDSNTPMLYPDPAVLPPIMSPMIQFDDSLQNRRDSSQENLAQDNDQVIEKKASETLFYNTGGSSCKLNEFPISSYHGIYVPISDDAKHSMYQDPIDAHSVVPLSKILATKYVNPSKVSKPMAKALPEDKKYFLEPSKSSNSLFISPDVSIDPKPHPPAGKKSTLPLHWSLEEDDIIIRTSGFSQFNWQLAADFVHLHNHGFKTGNSIKQPLDCYMRYQILATNSAGSASKKEDLKRRASRHMHFFDGISKIVKKRDSQKSSANATKNTSSSPNVSLNAHISHQAIATRAGVDPRKWKTPEEHSERRWKMQTMNMPGRPGMDNATVAAAAVRHSGARVPGVVGSPAVQPSQRASSASSNRNSTGLPMSMTHAQVQHLMQRPALLRQAQATAAAQFAAQQNALSGNSAQLQQLATMNNLMSLSHSQPFQNAINQRFFVMRPNQQQQQQQQQRQFQTQQIPTADAQQLQQSLQNSLQQSLPGNL